MPEQKTLLQIRPQISAQLALSNQGFTLVEIIVSMAIFAIAVMTAASIFGGTSKMIRSSQTNNELARLVDEDLAYVMQSNERLTCTAGACALNTSDTNRNSYFPDVPSSGAPTVAQQNNVDFFETICTSKNTAAGFAAKLNNLLAAPSDLRISRTITPAPLNNPSHLFTVTYTSNTGQFQRQHHLIPTTVSWCPALVP